MWRHRQNPFRQLSAILPVFWIVCDRSSRFFNAYYDIQSPCLIVVWLQIVPTPGRMDSVCSDSRKTPNCCENGRNKSGVPERIGHPNHGLFCVVHISWRTVLIRPRISSCHLASRWGRRSFCCPMLSRPSSSGWDQAMGLMTMVHAASPGSRGRWRNGQSWR